jgi:hypothetical protein
MGEGLDLHTAIQAVGFLLLIGVAVFHRHRVNHALAALPEETRERLGLIKPDDVSARKHRRIVARRLLLRGLPGWIPLGEESRRDLFWYRASGLGAIAYLAALPIAWGAAGLTPIMAPLLAAVLAITAWIDGPWGGPG